MCIRDSSTAERVAMVDAAVADGYNVIVMPGYAFAETIKETAELDVYKRQHQSSPDHPPEAE